MPKWQRAKIIHIERPEYFYLVGRHVWTEIGRVEPCGAEGCEMPAIRLNYLMKERSKALSMIIDALADLCGIDEAERNKESQDVIHLCDLELLDEFEDELPILTHEQWMEGRER